MIDRLSVMQPYIYPYIGYFQLIEASKKIIFYDDVNYIKQGWVNRNQILVNNQAYTFTLPLVKASSNKLICELEPLINDKFLKGFFNQLHAGYKKAPNYLAVKELCEQNLTANNHNIADLCIAGIVGIYNYLGRPIVYDKSSACSAHTKGLDRADRLIAMCKETGFSAYVNAKGGQDLYQKDYFATQGIQLSFIQAQIEPYNQFKQPFVPSLSILDILMFNSKDAVNHMLQAYTLI